MRLRIEDIGSCSKTLAVPERLGTSRFHAHLALSKHVVAMTACRLRVVTDAIAANRNFGDPPRR